MFVCNHCQKSFDKPRALSAHRCEASQRFKTDLLEKNRDEIIDKYQNQKISIYELAINYKVAHLRIRKFLEKHNIEMDFWSNPERRAVRTAKARNTMKERYGVDNVAQLQSTKEKVKDTCKKRYGVNNGAESISSSIKHYILGNDVEPHMSDQYERFKQEVSKITQKNTNNIEFTGRCYYTDTEISKNRHFNNVFKATIDHKIPVILGFEQGLTPEDIGSVNNLVWCARLVNTYKRNMTEEQFKASGIIERFKKYESHLRNCID